MSPIIVVLKKDLTILFFKKKGIIEALLLGLIIIFTFSLASSNLEVVHPVWSGTIFWVCSLFCCVLIFRELYRIEERDNVFELLIIAPISKEGIWISKTIAGFIATLFLQIFFLILMVIFLKIDLTNSLLYSFVSILLIDLGICIMGSFFGGAMAGSHLKDSLLTTILFPLEIPLVLGGIKIYTQLISGGTFDEISGWIRLIIGYDAIFAGICLFLYPYILGDS